MESLQLSEAAPIAFLHGVGLPELVIIGVIVLLLFGSRLPSLMNSLGRSVVEFKKGVRDDGDEATRVEDDDRKRGPRE